MSKLRHLNSFTEDIDHEYDEYKSSGYKFERNILKNVISPELFSNPVNDTPLRQIEKLFEYLIDRVRQIKLTYAYMFPKNSKLIN